MSIMNITSTEEYNKALAEVRTVADPYDNAELVENQEKKEALSRWWEKQARDFLKATQDIDLDERRKHWKSYRYLFDLDPFGYLIVSEYKNDERGTYGDPNVWSMNKAEILDRLEVVEVERALRERLNAEGAAATMRRLQDK